jgi:hypothetical protein
VFVKAVLSRQIHVCMSLSVGDSAIRRAPIGKFDHLNIVVLLTGYSDISIAVSLLREKTVREVLCIPRLATLSSLSALPIL